MDKPLIFDIARASLADGKGIRTVVFFKGCPLSCVWCHNPESQSKEKEYFHYPERCIQCNKCEEGCFSNTKEKVGVYKEPSILLKEILKDKAFYDSSGGGVTFSGGEPLLWVDYLAPILEELKKHEININIETCGYFNFNEVEKKLLNNIDSFYFDLKIMDDKIHEKYTGKSNEIIHNNLMKLVKKNVNIICCIPLVPEIIANETNLKDITEFMKSLQIKEYKLLTYNNSFINKYKKLNRKLSYLSLNNLMTLEDELKWKNYFKVCLS